MAIISEVTGKAGSELPTAWERANTGKDVPLPPPAENYLQAVRKSTAEYINGSQELVKINADAVSEYIDNLDREKFDAYVGKTNHWPKSLPLKFDNTLQEMDFVALVDLLQVGSGFRKELHKASGRGASDTIVAGCMSLYISQTSTDARGLQELTLGDISEHFRIPLLGPERALGKYNTAVTISDASDVRPLAEILLGILQDTGRRLQQSGFPSFSAFLVSICTEESTAAHLVQKLVAAFPSLRDAAMINDQPVYLFKKAQLITYDICQTFRQTNKIFDFPDISEMTMFADNVVPAMVQHHGLITPCETIARKIDQGEELTLTETTGMRAASIVAAELVTKYANTPDLKKKEGKFPINQATLDQYWWKEGKDPELRKINRLVHKNTIYF